MSDLISRQAAIDALKNRWKKTRNYEGIGDDIAEECELYLKQLPSAQPERNTAEWIYGEKDGADGWYCSKCGFHIPWDYDYYGLNNIDFIRDFHTCPHCDAKMLKYTGMDGEKNDTLN